MEACLDGLAVAHQDGIVHKDLKPSNLFVCEPQGKVGERLTVIDFGVARVAGTPTNMSDYDGRSQAVGTPAYMAPEYLRGEGCSPRVDVYQLGLVMAEMITGVPVVTGDNDLACAMIHLDRRLVIPPVAVESLLGDIIVQATDPDPEQRLADASELRDAVAAVRTRLEAQRRGPHGTVHDPHLALEAARDNALLARAREGDWKQVTEEADCLAPQGLLAVRIWREVGLTHISAAADLAQVGRSDIAKEVLMGLTSRARGWWRG